MTDTSRRRRTFTLLTLLVVATSSSSAGGQVSPPRETKVSGLRAHEWGVWKLQAGRVAHLEELARETPGFVLRSGQAPASSVAPVIPRPPAKRPGPTLFPRPVQPLPMIGPTSIVSPARKPVLFLYTDRPTAVTVTVGFLGGEPWLFYPAAELVAAPGVGLGLRWSGQLVPRSKTALVAAPSDHWWQDLRQVGADLFLSTEGTAERFLFYDGPVAFERPFQVTRQAGGASVLALSTEQVLWLVEGDTVIESRVQRGLGVPTVVTRGDLGMLRRRLSEELGQRGLNQAETRSLFETWRDDLFESSSPRAIFFVPRHLYDRMLPLQITPTPIELVRVGLVIEEL